MTKNAIIASIAGGIIAVLLAIGLFWIGLSNGLRFVVEP